MKAESCMHHPSPIPAQEGRPDQALRESERTNGPAQTARARFCTRQGPQPAQRGAALQTPRCVSQGKGTRRRIRAPAASVHAGREGCFFKAARVAGSRNVPRSAGPGANPERRRPAAPCRGCAQEPAETFPGSVLEDVCRAEKSLVPGQESGRFKCLGHKV